MKKRLTTSRVIFHHSLSTSGGVQQIREWHLARGWEDIGYHYVVTDSGDVQSGRDLRLQGAHTYGRNRDSVGVCLVGDFRYTEPSYEQIGGAQRLYHQLCRIYSKSLDIEFHRDTDDQNPCPGVMLDRYDFLEILKRADPYHLEN